MDDTEIRFGGRVTVKQDDEVIFEYIPNHIVNLGLKNLGIGLIGSGWYVGVANTTLYGQRYYANILVGTNTTTPTTITTTDLTNKIATNPSSFNSTAPTAQTTTRWVIQYNALWNAGVITSQVGEIGLYNGNFTGTYAAGWTSASQGAAISYAAALFSRVSAADGDFQAFTPDSSKSLVITWEIGVIQ
jgi:hypothetical protein